MELNKILDRVRKLLAIAQDHRANPNEAAAAASQAENIMRKFNIDNADVLLKEARMGEVEFDTVDVYALMKRNVDNGHQPKKVPAWAGWLAVRVAKLNDCDVKIAWGDRGACARFQGYKSDAQVAGWMYDYLLNAMINDLRAWQRTGQRTKVESNDFRNAHILAMCGKLKTMQDEREAAMRGAGASAGALIVAKANAVAAHFGAVKYGAGRGIQFKSNGANAGHEAGKRVDVGRRAVGGNGTAGALLLGC